MKIIGLIGGSGAGKSEIAKLIASNYNAYIINADEIGHEIINKTTISYKKIINYFGTDILDTSGNINRVALGNIVFKETEKLEKLNEFTHPYMYARIKDKLDFLRKEKKYDFIVLEAAVMIEAKLIDLIDSLWYVFSDYEIRLTRLIEYRNIPRKKAIDIIKKQKSDMEYRQYADFVIDNNLSIESTMYQIREILKLYEEEYH